MLHVKISNENGIKRSTVCLHHTEMKKAVPCNTSFLKQTREHDSLVNWILPSKAQKSSLLLFFRKGLRCRSALRVFSRILLEPFLHFTVDILVSRSLAFIGYRRTIRDFHESTSPASRSLRRWAHIPRLLRTPLSAKPCMESWIVLHTVEWQETQRKSNSR